MANLPKDPVILFSCVNTRLRDDGVNLDELCAECGQAREQIESLLATAGYFYDEKENKFLPRG